MLIALILAGVMSGQVVPATPSAAPPELVLALRGRVRRVSPGPVQTDPGSRGPGGPLMDKDGDGFVTREEFTAPLIQVFDFLDKNDDGKVSTEELVEGRAAVDLVLGGPGRGPGRGPAWGGPPMSDPHRPPYAGRDDELPPPPPRLPASPLPPAAD